jgi:peptidyl-prolyl cis-trans isomerase D
MGKKLGVNAKASHILISYEGTKVPNKRTTKKKKKKGKAEELKLSESDSFMMLAFLTQMIHQRSKVEDLGYFSQNQMVKPFNDFVSSIGSIGLVETPGSIIG